MNKNIGFLINIICKVQNQSINLLNRQSNSTSGQLINLQQNKTLNTNNLLKTTKTIQKYHNRNSNCLLNKIYHKYSSIVKHQSQYKNNNNKQQHFHQLQLYQIKSKINQCSIKLNAYLLMNLSKQTHKYNQIKQKHKQRVKQRENHALDMINILIKLIKTYNLGRYKYVDEKRQLRQNGDKQQQSKNSKQKIQQVIRINEQMNKLIIESIQLITSGLHYIVSSQQYNMRYLSSNKLESEFPLIGSLIKLSNQMLQLHIKPKSQQYDRLVMSMTELLDLYMSSYINFVDDKVEHLMVYDVCDLLIKFGVNYSFQKINSLIKDKYNNSKNLNMIKEWHQSDQYINIHSNSNSNIQKSYIKYHKSLLADKGVQPSWKQPKPQYNYTYSQIDRNYFVFVKQQINSRVISPKISKYVKGNIQQKIDKLTQNRVSNNNVNEKSKQQRNKLQLINDTRLYVQWIRMFYLYQQVTSSSRSILIRIQYLIELVTQFINSNNSQQVIQYSPYLSQFNIKQSLLYLVYFYLQYVNKLEGSEYVGQYIDGRIGDERSVQQLYSIWYQFIRSNFIQNNHINTNSYSRNDNDKNTNKNNISQKNNDKNRKQNILFSSNLINNPKLQCIQLQILYKILILQIKFKLYNSVSNQTYNSINNQKNMQLLKQTIKTNPSIIQSHTLQLLVTLLNSKNYKAYPYIYLNWFYSRCYDILQLIKNNSQTIQLSQTIINANSFDHLQSQLLLNTIQALTHNPLNKLSKINKIYSIFIIIKHLSNFNQLNTKSNFNQQYINVKNQYLIKINNWLCEHTPQQLLTQQQQDLCQIFQHLLPYRQTYRHYLTYTTQISFGQFKWQSFNKLYYYSLLYYIIPINNNQYNKSNININKLKQKLQQKEKMNMEYVRRYILNQYNAMGISRREIPTNSYFYKILQIQTPQSFYKNYFENYGHHH